MILSWLEELINEVIDLAEIRFSRYLNFVKDLAVTSLHRHFFLRVVLCHLTVKPSVVAPPGLIFIYVCLCQSCAYRLPYLCLLIKPSHYFCIDETVSPGGSWRSGFKVVPMWPCELFSISSSLLQPAPVKTLNRSRWRQGGWRLRGMWSKKQTRPSFKS